MGQLRISQLSREQIEAVFRSERFCELSSDQLSALHHRSEQLRTLQHRARLRRRQWRIAVAALLGASAAFCIALILAKVDLLTFFAAMFGLAVIAFVWLAVVASVVAAVHTVIEKIAKPKASQGGGSLQAISKD